MGQTSHRVICKSFCSRRPLSAPFSQIRLHLCDLWVGQTMPGWSGLDPPNGCALAAQQAWTAVLQCASQWWIEQICSSRLNKSCFLSQIFHWDTRSCSVIVCLCWMDWQWEWVCFSCLIFREPRDPFWPSTSYSSRGRQTLCRVLHHTLFGQPTESTGIPRRYGVYTESATGEIWGCHRCFQAVNGCKETTEYQGGLSKACSTWTTVKERISGLTIVVRHTGAF